MMAIMATIAQATMTTSGHQRGEGRGATAGFSSAAFEAFGTSAGGSLRSGFSGMAVYLCEEQTILKERPAATIKAGPSRIRTADTASHEPGAQAGALRSHAIEGGW